MPGSKLITRDIKNTVSVSCTAGRGAAVLSMKVAGSTHVIRCGDILHSPHSSEDVSTEGSVVSYREGSVGDVTFSFFSLAVSLDAYCCDTRRFSVWYIDSDP